MTEENQRTEVESAVPALLIKLTRAQRDLVRIQAEVVAWDGTESNGTVEVASERVKEIKEKVEDIRDQFDQWATEEEAINNEPTFATIIQSVHHLTIAIRDVSLNRTRNKTMDQSFKLEKIKTPTFSGEFSDWQEFHDLFLAAVHNNATLTGAAKMVHLKSALKGDAAPIVSNYPSTSQSYALAWKSVTDRYSNKREIVFAHLRKLWELKGQPDTSVGLRKLCDTFNECTRSLKLLKLEVDKWDVILVFLALEKSNEESKKQWLLTQGDELPKLSTLLEFWEKRATALAGPSKSSSKKSPSTSTSSYHTTQGQSKGSCPYCNEGHPLYKCNEYNGLSIQGRSKYVNKAQLCTNCLSANKKGECPTKATCKKCGKPHHTSLHFERKTPSTSEASGSSQQSSSGSTGQSKQEEPVIKVSSIYTNSSSKDTVVLLATLLVDVHDKSGQKQQCRIFLDSGSEANFISEAAVDRLGLHRYEACANVGGFGGVAAGTATGFVSFKALSKACNFQYQMEAFVFGTLAEPMPRFKCQATYRHIQGLSLADPTFYEPSHVDILMGTVSAAQILIPGLRLGSPLALNSKFGWILLGSAIRENNSHTSSYTISVRAFHSQCSPTDPCLESSLRRFWEIEEPEPLPHELPADDKYAEEHFQSTHTRDTDGRFLVRFPFSSPPTELGQSRAKALQCFLSMEKKIRKDPLLERSYRKQMEDYHNWNWTEQVPSQELSKPSYYIPHHVVTKLDSTTTKYRIVFNASAKTTSGHSLNSILLPGPKIQLDLQPLLVRFRTHPIALSADIVKFFNQVKVSASECDFQRFLWRKNKEAPIQDFRFLRLTFGLTCSPFLAIRCLHELGVNNKDKFPLACQSIREDLLVDNLLSGAATVTEALHRKSEITEVLKGGQFSLQKWASNHPDVTSSLSSSEREEYSLDIANDDSIKTIGLFWHPASDTFGVKIVTPAFSSTATKREVLSFTARIFDPLSWLAPVTITPKIFLQSLWKEKLDWDTPIPPFLFNKWRKYCLDLELLRSFRISRCLTSIPPSPTLEYELVGFCDASNAAYASCIYLRAKGAEGFTVELIAAKTKVSPVHGETTPRLELCSAVLLKCLVNSTITTLLPTKIKISSVKCFTDSTGALGQIFSTEKQPLFVTNRVRKIRNSSTPINWYHVPGEQNPADPASRGISAAALLKHPLWLHGPPFLLTEEIPPQPYPQSQVSSFVTSLHPPSEGSQFVSECLIEFINRSDSFPKMTRLIAYWIRFVDNLRNPQQKRYGPLTAKELQRSLIPIVKTVQSQYFKTEIQQCVSHGPVTSNVKFLSPFLDSDGVLRVGGRLQQSLLGFEQRHPILLPKSHPRSKSHENWSKGHFTRVVARHLHESNLHAGPQLLLSLLRRQFWVPRGQALCSSTVRKCVKCHRHNPTPLNQIMGQLPPPRVVPDFPFAKVGLDYAGPFKLAVTTGRNPRYLKAYVSLWVCMATKAVHLELATDLTTEAFIASFERFLSIRNVPSDVYCDGGTNFAGAKNEMEELHTFINDAQHQQKVAQYFAGEKVEYHFNPPLGPHHGGLWEAAVKSMKYHLKRIMDGHHLSIEEFLTLLAKTSAALNSRPLTPLSNSPDDFEVLTPFHFLTLRPPKVIPQENLMDIRQNRLNRWQLAQQMAQHLFRRWSTQYLQTLQQKHKWLEPQTDVTPGLLVLVHDDDGELGPQKWILGRIEKVYPGPDGKVRVTDVRIPTPNDDKKKKQFRILRRPITRLSPLPIDQALTSSYTRIV